MGYEKNQLVEPVAPVTGPATSPANQDPEKRDPDIVPATDEGLSMPDNERPSTPTDVKTHPERTPSFKDLTVRSSRTGNFWAIH